MDRRTFVALAAVSAGAAAAGALGACSVETSPVTRTVTQYTPAGYSAVSFAAEFDVVVIGSGMAGLSAAMLPVEAGYSVAVVDKLAVLGGESYESDGVMLVAGSDVQHEAGITLSVQDAWEQFGRDAVDVPASDTSFAQTLFETAPEWVQHLVAEYGASFADPASYAHVGITQALLLPQGGIGSMTDIMVPLRDGLTDRGVTFETGQRAVACIVDAEGAICGVRFIAEEGTSVLDVKARRVVVATGGFASSQPMIHEYVPDQEHIGCYTFASMGEGLKLCERMNASLGGMDTLAHLTGDTPQVDAWGLFGPVLAVDAQGNRFAREDVPGAVADACQTDMCGLWWTIFDGQMSEGIQSRSVAEITSTYTSRIVGPFDDVEALADGMGVPRDTLKQTWDRFQEHVKAQKDSDFGRELYLQSLEAPYYAIKQVPVRFRSCGGVQTDNQGRVVDGVGAPIEHLYCCGAAANGGLGGLASAGAYGFLVGKALVDDLQAEDAQQ